jgi:6-pyruvoyltetrahydropterin/6-carboxytetrahydropterin synthase
LPLRLTKTFTFEAAHRLPNVATGHPCGRHHGHSYRVTLGLEGELDGRLGWVQDFGEIKEIFAPMLRELDHTDLNELDGLLNPTAEHLAIWIYERLKPRLPLLADVTVQETPTSAAIYRP